MERVNAATTGVKRLPARLEQAAGRAAGWFAVHFQESADAGGHCYQAAVR